MKQTRTYRAWANMKSRCANPKVKSYPHYGGRGITICDRWMTFANFLEDMGEHPGKGYSLDRVDNEKGYSPENCRWVSWIAQNNNSRKNVLIRWRGEQMTVAECARRLSMCRTVLGNRIKRGWTIEDATAIPTGGRRNARTSLQSRRK